MVYFFLRESLPVTTKKSKKNRVFCIRGNLPGGAEGISSLVGFNFLCPVMKQSVGFSLGMYTPYTVKPLESNKCALK